MYVPLACALSPALSAATPRQRKTPLASDVSDAEIDARLGLLEVEKSEQQQQQQQQQGEGPPRQALLASAKPFLATVLLLSVATAAIGVLVALLLRVLNRSAVLP